MSIQINELVIGIKSAGEIASGIACRLFNSNITNIFMMDTSASLAVRRRVSFCEVIHEAQFDDKIIVEGVEAKKAVSFDEIPHIWDEKKIPIIGRIPYNRDFLQSTINMKPTVETYPKYRKVFQGILSKVLD